MVSWGLHNCFSLTISHFSCQLNIGNIFVVSPLPGHRLPFTTQPGWDPLAEKIGNSKTNWLPTGVVQKLLTFTQQLSQCVHQDADDPVSLILIKSNQMQNWNEPKLRWLVESGGEW